MISPQGVKDIHDRVLGLKEALKKCCRDNGRAESGVALMAVTKTRTWEEIQAVVEAGVDLIGENRAQEMLSRFVLPWPHGDRASLHFIGHLQKNKIRKVLPWVRSVDSVDDEETLHILSRVAGEGERELEVCLEVNTSGEASKQGIGSFSELCRLAEVASSLPSLQFRGLMTIGPLGNDQIAIGKAFASLRTMAEGLVSRGLAPDSLGLSMGMSDDWPIAVAEGSTMVRIGTALFGARE